MSFSRATTFNLDEFLGVAPSDPGSYRTYMELQLHPRVDVVLDRLAAARLGGWPDLDGRGLP